MCIEPTKRRSLYNIIFSTVCFYFVLYLYDLMLLMDIVVRHTDLGFLIRYIKKLKNLKSDFISIIRDLLKLEMV